MDPISAGIGLLGFGLQLFGGLKAAKIAKEQAAVSADIAKQEMAIDDQKRMAMELDANRKSMEVLRNNQKARSMALYNATTQGAQQGSGLQGGYGQIYGESGNNLLGINQDLAIGEKVFDLNKVIDQDKIQLAALGGDAASAQGLSGLGSDVMGATKFLTPLLSSAFGGGLGGSKSGGTSSGGGFSLFGGGGGSGGGLGFSIPAFDFQAGGL